MTMMTQRHLLSSTMVLWGILFGWLSLITRTATACDCVALTFNDQFDAAPFVDAVYIYGRANVDNSGNFDSLMDEDDIALDKNQDPFQDSYFLIWIWMPLKGCMGAGTYEILVSEPVGASCGISPEPGWYMLATWNDSNAGYRRMSLCGMWRPWDTINDATWLYADSNKDACPTPVP